MSWQKDYHHYCRYCEERGKYKHLRYWDNDAASNGLRCVLYYCKKCGSKYDENSIQQICASCDEIYYQDDMPEMCDSCIAMLCQDCVDSENYERCFRCNDRICTRCIHSFKYKNKKYIACEHHYQLDQITCKRYIKTLYGVPIQCKHITGPNRKYCKQHRYQHRRKRYVKK